MFAARPSLKVVTKVGTELAAEPFPTQKAV